MYFTGFQLFMFSLLVITLTSPFVGSLTVSTMKYIIKNESSDIVANFKDSLDNQYIIRCKLSELDKKIESLCELTTTAVKEITINFE